MLEPPEGFENLEIAFDHINEAVRKCRINKPDWKTKAELEELRKDSLSAATEAATAETWFNKIKHTMEPLEADEPVIAYHVRYKT